MNEMVDMHLRQTKDICVKCKLNKATENFAESWIDITHGLYLRLCKPCLISHLKHKIKLYQDQIKNIVTDMNAASIRPKIQRASGIIEVLCEHGIGHPTKDSAEKVAKDKGHKIDGWLVHGCDGCCKKEGFFK